MKNLEIRGRTKKKKVISAAFLITSVYASILFTSGLLLGYLATKLFYEKYVSDDPNKLMYLNFRGRRIHLHHWISGAVVLLAFFVFGVPFGEHKIFLGLICGFIVHDIYDFNDWTKIVTAKEKAV